MSAVRSYKTNCFTGFQCGFENKTLLGSIPNYFSVDWVKAKLKTLRNSYTKAKKPGSSGSARKSLTKRAAWLLDKLQFLAPHVATRTSISNIDTVSI